VGFHAMAMDYRGFGLSVGSWSSHVAPNATVYQGTQVSRIAADAHEILSTFKRDHIVLMGHSFGGSVAYAMISVFSPRLVGLVILDQDPKIMSSSGSLPADPSYPPGQGSDDFSFASVLAQLKKYREFSQAGVDIRTRFANASHLRYHYPGVYRVFANQFTAVQEAPVENQTQGGFFLLWYGLSPGVGLWYRVLLSNQRADGRFAALGRHGTGFHRSAHTMAQSTAIEGILLGQSYSMVEVAMRSHLK